MYYHKNNDSLHTHSQNNKKNGKLTKTSRHQSGRLRGVPPISFLVRSFSIFFWTSLRREDLISYLHTVQHMYFSFPVPDGGDLRHLLSAAGPGVAGVQHRRGLALASLP